MFRSGKKDDGVVRGLERRCGERECTGCRSHYRLVTMVKMEVF